MARARRYLNARVVAFCGDDVQIFDAATRRKVAAMNPDQVPRARAPLSLSRERENNPP